MQLKSNMAVTDTTSSETSVQHTSIKPLIIQSTDGQYYNFCKKRTVHLPNETSTYITYLYGLALECQDFRLLDLKKGIAPGSSHKPNLNFVIRISPPHFIFPRTIVLFQV